MKLQKESVIEDLYTEGMAEISESQRQKLMLSNNLNRLQHQLADLTELHRRVLEQMSITGELIAIINEKKTI